MNRELFWVHKSVFGGAEAGVGFSTFSAPHLIWLALLTLFIAASAARYRRSGAKGRDNMRKGMALFLILFEIFKQGTMALTGAPVHFNLPLEVCSFAEYTILADALWPDNRLFKQLLVFAFLPAAIMALVFPTVTVYPPISFYAIHQFVLHAVIVAYIVARYAAGEIRPRYPGIWTSVLVIGLLAIPIYQLDVTFGANFMFLTKHADNPMLKVLWNLSGGNGGLAYIAALIAFITLVLHVMFLIYTLLGRASKKRAEKAAG